MEMVKMMRRKGFTLIELMVVLGIITIIATASVPQIQLWTARNRGVQAVSQIISDFSKAKSIAITITKQQQLPVELAGAYVFGSRPQIALFFEQDRYYIIQRDGMKQDGWIASSDKIIKMVSLPRNIVLQKVNDQSVSSGIPLVITSAGRLKKEDGSFIVPVNNVTYMQTCGDQQSELKGVSVFMITLKATVSGTNSLWYRLEIGQGGEYFICSSSVESFTGATSNVLEL